MEAKRVTIKSTTKELEAVSGYIINIMGCLEALENSIYFSSERKDKDMSKPNAAAVEAILKMTDHCLDALGSICDKLKKLDEEVQKSGER